MMRGKRMKIASLNANGLRDAIKRSRTIDFLRSLDVDVVALQDTRFDQSRDEFWKTAMGHRSWWTPKVAIIIFNSQIIVEEDVSVNDRILSLTLRIEDFSLRFSSVYLPANPTERISFIVNTLPLLEPHPHSIIAGDFNMYPSKFLDHTPPPPVISPRWKVLDEQLVRLQVKDLLRHHEPEAVKFTH
jgi:exonuclease III